MIKLVVAGAAGRMGQTILNCALRDKAFRIVGAVESAKSPNLGQSLADLLGKKSLDVKITHDAKQALRGADVLIDFTHPSSLKAHLSAVTQTKAGYVIGTTGISDVLMKAIAKSAKRLPIVQSPNMSIGVNLLFKLSEMTAKVLDEDYDIEISEIHHKMKKDAPSGTAVKLLEVTSAARKKNIKKNTLYGRQGEVGARKRGEIGVFALRGGDVVGDHTVHFFGDAERIELTHKASSREAFALGSLRAAKFVARRRSGLYNMQQVLGMA